MLSVKSLLFLLFLTISILIVSGIVSEEIENNHSSNEDDDHDEDEKRSDPIEDSQIILPAKHLNEIQTEKSLDAVTISAKKLKTVRVSEQELKDEQIRFNSMNSVVGIISSIFMLLISMLYIFSRWDNIQKILSGNFRPLKIWNLKAFPKIVPPPAILPNLDESHSEQQPSEASKSSVVKVSTKSN
ncbi:hypothetical protein NH340_JMT05755 [Sarcoptes scabiei]|nr:hypothetical protein NH340_JMT05755 [Sarcoptes scabiei]